MANFETSTVSASDIRAELATVQSDYRTTASMLASAKHRKDKSGVRELTRAKNRISAKLDALKSQLNNLNSY